MSAQRREPRTETGRRMLAAWARRPWSLMAMRIGICDIEAEAKLAHVAMLEPVLGPVLVTAGAYLACLDEFDDLRCVEWLDALCERVAAARAALETPV